MTKIYEMINSENVIKIAEEIVEIFKTQASDENIDYEFTIKNENGKIYDNNANTFFYFDTSPNSTIDKFKKILFNEDLKDIEENSEEEKELMTDVNVFLQNICKRISNFYKEDLKEVIRNVILGNKSQKEQIPLNDIQILSIDIADFSSVPEPYKYLLKIQKKPETEIDVDEIVMYVQDKEENGQSIEDTLNIEHQSGNPIFKNVLKIEKGRKYLNEISLYIFVDYSLQN